MDLDKEKTVPESETKETGTDKIKQVAKQDILDLSRDEYLQKMKDRYGETEDSFIKGIRGNEEYEKKCQKMSDKEVLEFAKTDLDLKEYHSKVIHKKINKPKEEIKPVEKPAEPKKEPEKKPDDTPKEDVKKEDNKPEVKPIEKPAEAKKEADKKSDDKPKEKKKHFRSNRFKKKSKKTDDKTEGKGFWKTSGDVITYLPKQAWKAVKFTAHQTVNLIKYPIRTTRSTVKFAWQYMDHGFSKVRREKNKDAYLAKWKWEQAAKKK